MTQALFDAQTALITASGAFFGGEQTRLLAEFPLLATTAPLIIADAEHIDNNFLINQAARHIGAGQYDLTLDAPVVVYQ